MFCAEIFWKPTIYTSLLNLTKYKKRQKSWDWFLWECLRVLYWKWGIEEWCNLCVCTLCSKNNLSILHKFDRDILFQLIIPNYCLSTPVYMVVTDKEKFAEEWQCDYQCLRLYASFLPLLDCLHSQSQSLAPLHGETWCSLLAASLFKSFHFFPLQIIRVCGEMCVLRCCPKCRKDKELIKLRKLLGHICKKGELLLLISFCIVTSCKFSFPVWSYANKSL